jgi:hypothetical protein
MAATPHDCCAFFDSRNRTNTAKATTYFAVHRLVPSPAGVHLTHRRSLERLSLEHSLPSDVVILVMWCANVWAIDEWALRVFFETKGEYGCFRGLSDAPKTTSSACFDPYILQPKCRAIFPSNHVLFESS